jgi:hypothetical protein
MKRGDRKRRTIVSSSVARSGLARIQRRRQCNRQPNAQQCEFQGVISPVFFNPLEFN